MSTEDREPSSTQAQASSRKRPTWNQLRSKLETVGFKPSKRLGQNFLVDDGLCRVVAVSGGVEPGATVLEVGVGLGFLTAHLLELGAHVIGVEVDQRLLPIARQWLEPAPELELVQTDVLAGKHQLAPAVVERLPVSEPWSLVSNLPYAVASPVVALLARLANPPQSMTVLVQHEVAERLCASEGGRGWGPLGARLALFYEGRILRSVGADGFRPRPKVDSSICRLERRADGPGLAPAELRAYDALATQVFTQRRKRLRSPLSGLCEGLAAADHWIAEAEIDPTLRVEELAPAALLTLVRTHAGAEFLERFAESPPEAR
jgi:16S rRNA (adenine1518-N6/adenine1519-N6)-dimethyltransferase